MAKRAVAVVGQAAGNRSRARPQRPIEARCPGPRPRPPSRYPASRGRCPSASSGCARRCRRWCPWAQSATRVEATLVQPSLALGYTGFQPVAARNLPLPTRWETVSMCTASPISILTSHAGNRRGRCAPREPTSDARFSAAGIGFVIDDVVGAVGCLDAHHQRAGGISPVDARQDDAGAAVSPETVDVRFRRECRAHRIPRRLESSRRAIGLLHRHRRTPTAPDEALGTAMDGSPGQVARGDRGSRSFASQLARCRIASWLGIGGGEMDDDISAIDRPCHVSRARTSAPRPVMSVHVRTPSRTLHVRGARPSQSS